MPGTFVKNMTDIMPDNVILDPKLVTAINWLDDQGWAQSYPSDYGIVHNLPIYPPDLAEDLNISFVSFGASQRPYTAHWSTPSNTVNENIIEIAGTASDGGFAAIWVDDEGEQWFVHLGHDTLGVIGKDPLVLLQFLAMGYGEPGGLEATDITPLQQNLEYHGAADLAELEPEDIVQPPLAFQTFLTATFGVTLPATARDLGIGDFSYYGDETSTDPFVQWMIKVTPPPTEEDLAYIAELTKLAETMTIDDFDLETDPKPQGIFAKLKGLFGLQ